MAQKITYAVLAAALATAVWILLTHWETDSGWGRIMNPTKTHSTYDSREGYLRLSFDYPSSWQIVSDQGRIEPYNQVFVRGPRNAGGTLTATFVVRGQPVRNVTGKGRFDTVQHIRQNYTAHLYRDPKFLESVNTEVQGEPAETVAATYIMPPASSKAVSGASTPKADTPVRARAYFVKSGDILYEFIYSADERDFARFEPDFNRLIKSVRFFKSPA